MTMIELPPDFDLPAGHAASRRQHLLDEIQLRTPPRHAARGRWTLAGAGVLAVTITAGAVLFWPHGLSSQVLAYAFEPGDTLTYRFTYSEATRQTVTEQPPGVELDDGLTVTEAAGRFIYAITDGPRPATLTVSVTATTDVFQTGFSDPSSHPEAGPSTASPRTWPTIRLVTDPDGAVLDVPPGRNPEMFPAFILPDPTPGDLDSSLPLRLGPPLPDTPLAVGDTWTTEEPRWVPDEIVMVDDPDDVPAGRAGRTITTVGDHRIVRREDLADRDTLVIESEYVVPAFGGGVMRFEEARATTTVWFDPAAGIVVRAEILSRSVNHTEGPFAHDVEQETRFTVELVG